jgi:hypothetical protein
MGKRAVAAVAGEMWEPALCGFSSAEGEPIISGSKVAVSVVKTKWLLKGLSSISAGLRP